MARNAVFFSISNGEDRALVFHGTGKTLIDAWDTAAQCVEQFSTRTNYNMKWVKVDIVSASSQVSKSEVEELLKTSAPGNFRYGLAFDESFD